MLYVVARDFHATTPYSFVPKKMVFSKSETVKAIASSRRPTSQSRHYFYFFRYWMRAELSLGRLQHTLNIHTHMAWKAEASEQASGQYHIR